MRFARFFIVLSALVSLGNSLATADDASNVELKASVDRSDLKILEPIVLTVVAETAAKIEIVFPKYESTLGPFQIVSQQVSPSIPIQGGRREWILAFVLETMETGELEIPPIEFEYRSGDETLPIATEPIRVQVQSVLGDDDDPQSYRPIKGELMIEPISQSDHFPWWALLMIGLLLAILVVLFLLRRRQRMSPTAVEWAQQRLGDVRLAVENNELNPAEAYVQISLIARDFVAADQGLGIGATTDEVLAATQKGSWMTDDLRVSLVSLLRAAERLKFAGKLQVPAEMFAKYSQAEPIVHELIRSSVEQASERAGGV